MIGYQYMQDPDLMFKNTVYKEQLIHEDEKHDIQNVHYEDIIRKRGYLM